MPKKYQQKSLQIKPQSSSSHTLALSKPSASFHYDSSQRSVNDLIRESRRQQLRNEQQKTSPVTTTTAGSVPPSVRAVLDLPLPPPPPEPRAGRNRTAGASTPYRGHPSPLHQRRTPGPPPPRSWLTASEHASAKYRNRSSVGHENDGLCLQVRSSTLPGISFTSPTSLQNLALINIARSWAWHAEYDRDYLGVLPTSLKESLLSYIAVYNESAESIANPLKILFLNEEAHTQEDRDEVQRLDLGNAIGQWTSLKGIEKELILKTMVQNGSGAPGAGNAISQTPDTWDAGYDSDDNVTTLGGGPRVIHNFRNLKHLSLSISPKNARAASWASLLSVATELGTLTSLSLAYWPQPTFTPNAASTRALINVPGARPVVYGGTDMYASFDNNWREAAGILRTLSRALYCLTWLDLTGCGSWWQALQWSPSDEDETPDSFGPEWNGGWRGLEKLILYIGWRAICPIPPPLPSSLASDVPGWNAEHELLMHEYRKAARELMSAEILARSVRTHIRGVRKSGGGKWIDVDVDHDMKE